jgi:hypothetical protein
MTNKTVHEWLEQNFEDSFGAVELIFLGKQSSKTVQSKPRRPTYVTSYTMNKRIQHFFLATYGYSLLSIIFSILALSFIILRFVSLSGQRDGPGDHFKDTFSVSVIISRLNFNHGL